MKKIIFLAFIAVLLVSCATTKQTSESISESFYKKNAESFEELTLENGIPVIIKKSDTQRVFSLSIMIEGANALLDPSRSGLESMTLTMLAKGSKAYSYEDIQALTHKTQGSISGYASNGYSIFSLNCIDHYFDDLFPVFADSFLNPSFNQKEFTQVQNNNLQTLQSIMNDPFSLVQYSAERAVYENHPFETDIRPTYETIQIITLDDIASFHGSLLNAKRIKIIASGNIESSVLLEKLNAAFAKIPSLEYNEVSIPQVTISGETMLLQHPSASGTGFLVKTYSAPQFSDPDYVPTVLACTIYSEILYNVVREKHGACYSIGNSPVISKAPYMMLYVHSASDLENLPSYITEAETLMSEGKIIDSKNPETNEFTYLTLEETLEGYKNSLINSLFSTVVTASGSASQIMGSLHLTGKKEAYLELLKRIEQVTADDIRRAFEIYWLQSSGRWFIVTGPDDLGKIPVDSYK